MTTKAERLQPNCTCCQKKGFVPTSLLHQRGVRFCVHMRLPRSLYLILRRRAGVPWWRCYSPADSLTGMRSRSQLWRWQAVTPALAVSSGHTHARTVAPAHTLPLVDANMRDTCAHTPFFPQVSCRAHYETLSSSAPKLTPWSGWGFLCTCMERLLWFSLHMGGQVPFRARKPRREGIGGSSQRSVPSRWWISLRIKKPGFSVNVEPVI